MNVDYHVWQKGKIIFVMMALSLGGLVLVLTQPRINGARLLPLSTLAQRFNELDPAQPYYIHCKSGARSLQALQFLRQQGFKNLKSVKGGIHAWADEIDHSVPKY